MATATLEATSTEIPVDPKLVKAVVNSVNGGLVMCGAKARCVGIASVPYRDTGLVTGMIGVHGKASGFVTVNISQRMAIKLAEGLLQEKFDSLTSQVVDACGEITNIIVGGIKGELAGSDWSISNITVPSIIVGQGYQITYARGLQFLCAMFESDDEEAVMLEDRLLQVSISLLRL